MIKKNEPISLIESTEYLVKAEGIEVEELRSFIKKFSKLDIKKAKELKEKIRKLNLMKIKEEHIAKIIDLVPEDLEDLNKIFIDMNLDEDETKKVLETIKENK